MSVVYSLVDGVVVKTLTVTAKEEVSDWAEKESVVSEIEAEISHCAGIVAIYAAKKTAAEAKLDAINALK